MNLSARELELKAVGYQLEQGAITVGYHGRAIDPYFAIRALLSAHTAGLDIRSAAKSYIEWQLPRQESSGLFKRYCADDIPVQNTPSEQPTQPITWHSCADADADDALLAMWIELLYLCAPSQGLPHTWKNSVLLARAQLGLIFDKRREIYFISKTNKVGLLMDNIEIYAAFRRIAQQQVRLGLPQLAQRSAQHAEILRQSIPRVFRHNPRADWRVSTQAPEPNRFYPEQVAQLFPPLFALHAGNAETQQSDQKVVQAWLMKYQAHWLSLEADYFPWGLVALTASKNGAKDVAAQWVQRVTPLRHTSRWNVLEEAIFQALSEAP